MRMVISRMQKQPRMRAQSTTIGSDMSARLMRGAAMFAVFLLVVAAVFAARWGWADVVAQPVLQTQSGWQRTFVSTGQAPSANAWLAEYEKLALAQTLDPQNPAWMEAMGRLLATPVNGEESAADKAAIGKMNTLMTQNSASAELVKAVLARPVSPYSWANLAWAKYQSGQIDSVFYAALKNLALLGPWEPEVQFVVIDLGLALWDEMPKSLQPSVRQMATNAERRYSNTLLAIAAKRGKLNLVCSSEKLAKLAACRQIDVT